jgi:hypothetical protein
MVSSPVQTGQVAMTSWTIGSAARAVAFLAALGGPGRTSRYGGHDLGPVAMFITELQIEDARVEHVDWLLPEGEVALSFSQPMV